MKIVLTNVSVDGCNNGTAIRFFDITIPQDRDWQVDGAIFYSAVPWILALMLAAAFLITRRCSLGLYVLYGSVCVIVNEAIVKQAVKEARPYGSCLTTKGMPSSHSLLSIGYTLLVGLEMVFHQNLLHPALRVMIWFVVAVLLVPVPASRVKLKDHSELQVGVGSAMGFALAILYFLLVHFLLARVIQKWVKTNPWAEKLGVTFDYGWPKEMDLDKEMTQPTKVYEEGEEPTGQGSNDPAVLH